LKEDQNTSLDASAGKSRTREMNHFGKTSLEISRSTRLGINESKPRQKANDIAGKLEKSFKHEIAETHGRKEDWQLPSLLV